METKSKRDASFVIISLFDWHTKLYKNAIEGISDGDAQQRLNTNANHIGWIAGSMVHERYELYRFFGVDKKHPSYNLFKDHKGIQEGVIYPTLDEYRSSWDEISPLLKEKLLAIKEDEFDKPGPWQMPGETWSLYDTLVAASDREAYCIGQLGLWRRLLNYHAIKYQ